MGSLKCMAQHWVKYSLKHIFLIRGKVGKRVVIWMGKFTPLQLPLCFGRFPTPEQSQRCSFSSSHPNECWSGLYHHLSLLAPAVVKSLVVAHPYASRRTEWVDGAWMATEIGLLGKINLWDLAKLKKRKKKKKNMRHKHKKKCGVPFQSSAVSQFAC